MENMCSLPFDDNNNVNGIWLLIFSIIMNDVKINEYTKIFEVCDLLFVCSLLIFLLHILNTAFRDK